MRHAFALVHVLGVLGGLAAGVGGARPAAAADDGLTIGVLLPMSGPTATFGQESWDGIRIAEKEIRGKDPSFRFQLVLNDEQSKRELVGPQTKALIENNGAAIVVGSVASSNTMQAAIVCKEAGIPLLTPASTNDKLTDEVATYGENVFRVCFKDSFQGTMLARFAWNTLKAKKAASLVDKGQAYSVGLSEQFEKEFTRLGGTVATEFYTSDDKDYTTLVQKVGGTKPEVILLSGYYPQAGPMIRLSKEAWKGVPVIGGDGLDSPDLIPLAGETKAKVYFSTHFAADDEDPIVQGFVRKHQDAYEGRDPGAMSALGYDALYAVYEAAKRAKAAHPDAPNRPAHLAEALKGLEFTGVTGKIRIGPDRTPRKAIVIVRAAGSFKFVEKIQPE
jgi:branched-chain amino acid transport system substrate-binding protein